MQVNFVMCFNGCCLVTDPENPTGCTRISIKSLSADTDEVKVPFQFQCVKCKSKRVRLWRYVPVCVRIQELFRDPKTRSIIMSQRAAVAAAIEKAHQCIENGLDFLPDGAGSIFDGENFFLLCKTLYERGCPLTADDFILAFNFDGVELVKAVSTWPIMYMFHNLGPLYRHQKEYIHIAGLAGSLRTPDELNTFVWAMTLDMHCGFNKVTVQYEPVLGDSDYDHLRPGNVVSLNLRYFMLVTVQDLMALLKTSGLAVVSGKSCCPFCILPGLCVGTKHYMPLSVLPDDIRNLFPPVERVVALNNDYSRSRDWFEQLYTQILHLKRLGRGHGEEIKQLMTQSGIKRLTPMMFIPTADSLPGPAIAVDAMHSVFHGGFKNLMVRTLDKIGVAGKRIISGCIEGAIVPHDAIGGFQRIIDPSDANKTHYKGLAASDERFMMNHVLGAALFGVLPPLLAWAIAAFCFVTKFLAFFHLSNETLPRLNAMLFEIFCVVDEFFPPSDMKITMHILLHIVRWMMLNGVPRETWMFSFERMNQIFTRAATANRAPTITAMRRIRLDRFLDMLMAEHVGGDESAMDRLRRVENLRAGKVAGVSTKEKYIFYTIDERCFAFTKSFNQRDIVSQLNAMATTCKASRRESWWNSHVRSMIPGYVVGVYGTLYLSEAVPEIGSRAAAAAGFYSAPETKDDFENTSQVYHSTLYYLNSAANSEYGCVPPTKNGSYNLSCFARVRYQDENGSLLSGIAVILFFVVITKSMVARGGKHDYEVLARVHYFREPKALSTAVNVSTAAATSASSFHNSIAHDTDAHMKLHMKTECTAPYQYTYENNTAARKRFQQHNLGGFGKSVLPFRVIEMDDQILPQEITKLHAMVDSRNQEYDVFVPAGALLNKVVLCPLPTSSPTKSYYSVSDVVFSEPDALHL